MPEHDEPMSIAIGDITRAGIRPADPQPPRISIIGGPDNTALAEWEPDGTFTLHGDATDAAIAFTNAMRQLADLDPLDTEWEYAWEADETIRTTMSPRGPKIQFDDYPDTPEALAAFPKGRRIRRRRAGPWLDAGV